MVDTMSPALIPWLVRFLLALTMRLTLELVVAASIMMPFGLRSIYQSVISRRSFALVVVTSVISTGMLFISIVVSSFLSNCSWISFVSRVFEFDRASVWSVWICFILLGSSSVSTWRVFDVLSRIFNEVCTYFSAVSPVIASIRRVLDDIELSLVTRNRPRSPVCWTCVPPQSSME